MARRPSMGSAKAGIVVEGIKPLSRALKVLGEKDAPHLRDALTEGGQMLDSAAVSRAKGGIGAQMAPLGVKGHGAAIRFVIQSKHPGGRSMEFGRKWYYRGPGRSERFKAAGGQQARPYVGIVRGDAAIGATSDQISKILAESLVKEWERIGAEG